MAYILRRFRALLRRRLRNITRKAHGAIDTGAHTSSSSGMNCPPPLYSKSPPYSRSSPEANDLESLRARNPPNPPLFLRTSNRTPYSFPPDATPRETCEVIAKNAACNTHTALFEGTQRMAAAGAIRAIADAVSAAPSYASFIAAVTMAESIALMSIDDGRPDFDIDVWQRRYDHALDEALNAAESAEAATNARTWPCDTPEFDLPISQQDLKKQASGPDTKPFP